MEATQALPGGGTGRSTRMWRILAWVAAIAALLAVLELLGVPVLSWLHKLIKDVRAVPTSAVVGGAVLETLQTTFAALAWLTILRAAFPAAPMPFRIVLAPYAVGVALNAFLPANLGTWVMMLMFVAVIEGATFAAILSGFVVQKIPFTVLSIAVYVYLFLSVGKSLSLELNFLSGNPAGIILLALAVVVLLVLVGRFFWHRAEKLREELTAGAAILRQWRRFLVGVVLPVLASFAARLGIIAVFLAAYSIPVTFHTVIAITGSNSVSKSLSPTPGGAGVTQVLNVAALEGVTSKSNATAYSVAQQLIISAWDVVFAIALVVWVFGWTGGKELVRSSRSAAEVKRRELEAQRERRRSGE